MEVSLFPGFWHQEGFVCLSLSPPFPFLPNTQWALEQSPKLQKRGHWRSQLPWLAKLCCLWRSRAISLCPYPCPSLGTRTASWLLTVPAAQGGQPGASAELNPQKTVPRGRPGPSCAAPSSHHQHLQASPASGLDGKDEREPLPPLPP